MPKGEGPCLSVFKSDDDLKPSKDMMLQDSELLKLSVLQQPVLLMKVWMLRGISMLRTTVKAAGNGMLQINTNRVSRQKMQCVLLMLI